jgi:hypothetical protein
MLIQDQHMQRLETSRKLTLPMLCGIVVGTIVLAAWFFFLATQDVHVQGLYRLKNLIYLIAISSFLCGLFVYEFLKRRFKTESRDGHQVTGSKLGNRNTSVRCPNCNAAMVKRLSKRGATRGEFFFGCSSYPRCAGTRSMADAIWQDKPFSFFRDEN